MKERAGRVQGEALVEGWARWWMCLNLGLSPYVGGGGGLAVVSVGVVIPC